MTFEGDDARVTGIEGVCDGSIQVYALVIGIVTMRTTMGLHECRFVRTGRLLGCGGVRGVRGRRGA